MATVTISGQMDPTLGGDYGVGVEISRTAISYVWTSNDGHKVTLIGSFTYPGGPGSEPVGTIDEVLIDHDNDGSTDMSVVYAVPIAVSNTMFGSSIGLFSIILAEADTFDISGTINDFNPFAADGGNTTSQSDIINISGSGAVAGDRYIGGLNALGADDVAPSKVLVLS